MDSATYHKAAKSAAHTGYLYAQSRGSLSQVSAELLDLARVLQDANTLDLADLLADFADAVMREAWATDLSAR